MQDTLKFSGRVLSEAKPSYSVLSRAYLRTWGLRCALTDDEGYIVAGELSCTEVCVHSEACASIRRRAIEQSACWGESFLLQCPRERVVWGLPVMSNAIILGGLVVTVADIRSMGDQSMALSPADIHRATSDLLDLAVEANLTNETFLQSRRMTAQRESERAGAMIRLKDQGFQSIQDTYLVEESALIVAIKRGDRSSAKEILNRVLAGIYFLGRERPSVLKSLLLELVVMMSRSAVEAGGDPSELLGTNYSSFAELAQIETEEELCAWLVSTLERIMDAIKVNQHYPISVLLDVALKYMQEHLHDNLPRDEVASIACLSPSHFSRMIRQRFGQSFTDLLARMRVDKACHLLAHTEKSLIQVCLDCGFSDQSYFTKVFQKHTGCTPGEYRRLH